MNPASVLHTIARDLQRTEDSIAEQMADIQRIIERVSDAPTDGRMLNALGELQGRGTRLDTLIAIREEQREKLQMVADLGGFNDEDVAQAADFQWLFAQDEDDAPDMEMSAEAFNYGAR